MFKILPRIIASSFLFAAYGFCNHGISPSNSAGVVERVLEKEYESRPLPPFQEAPVINLDVPEPALDLCDGETIQIKSVCFEGNSIFPNAALEAISLSYLEREISLGDINRLCIDIQTAYLEKGYFLAIAFPPDQDITDGKLLIQIFEGTLGEIFVEGNQFYSKSFIAGFFTRFLHCPINYHEFIRAILLLNENADLSVELIFKKGSQLGTTDIILKVEDERPLHFYLDHNNYGTSSVSLWRSGLRVDYGNVFTDGDMVTVTEAIGVRARNLNFTDVIYRVPLNKQGTKLELSYIYSFFKVQQLTELHMKGKSEIGSVKISQAISRKKDLLLDGFIGFDYKQLKNYALGHVTSFDKLRVARFGFFADVPDRFLGRNLFEAYANFGIPKFLGGLDSEDERCSRFDCGGRFSYLNFDYTRIQPLPKNIVFIFNSSFQFTSDKLPVGEQLFIGGVDTVRGYPSAYVLGDYGYYTNFEFRFPPPFIKECSIPFTETKWGEVMSLLTFIDHGHVANNGKTIDEKKHFTLTGAGVGIRAAGPYGLETSLDVGFPLSHRRHIADATVYFKIGIQQ